jgi:predicted ATPase
MLKQLSIKNFKSIDQATLALTPLTILTGANSSGKSSTIQTLLLLIKNSGSANHYSMDELLRYLESFSAIRNKKNNAKRVQIEAIDSDDVTHSLDITMDGSETDSTLAYTYEARGKEPELLYLNANRLGAQDLIPLSQRKVGFVGEYLFSYFHKIKNNILADELIKFDDSPMIGYQLSQWLTLITGTATELVTEQFGEQVKVEFNVGDIEGNVSPFNLGAGISYIAKVLIICLMAKKGDIVLLENPEVQLHPESQSRLGEFLAFVASKGIQLIVETHSEHLINRIRVEVSEEHIDCDDVVIHYKASASDSFQTLQLDIDGHFVDQDENRQSFPKGFFDASVLALLSLR